MTPGQFKLMDDMEQIKAIALQGKKLSEREDALFYYNLYQIESFYIEEKIEKRTSNSFSSPSHFSTNVEITPYLQKIKTSQ